MGGRIGFSSSGQVSSLCVSTPGSPYNTEASSARVRSQDLFQSFLPRRGESTKEARRRGERMKKENSLLTRKRQKPLAGSWNQCGAIAPGS